MLGMSLAIPPVYHIGKTTKHFEVCVIAGILRTDAFFYYGVVI